MELNRTEATPEQAEALRSMGFEVKTVIGDQVGSNWQREGTDTVPSLTVYPAAYKRYDGLNWIGSHPNAHRKFPDPVTAAVWLLLEDSA